jgi:hypothetical protein
MQNQYAENQISGSGIALNKLAWKAMMSLSS